jgi:hypothetical protein
MDPYLYAIIVLDIVLWLMLVFEALLGMRVVKLKDAAHRRVHRTLAFVLIAGGLVNGLLLFGHLVLALF